jgi:hypothetical protein
MEEEVAKILKMIEEGKITAEQGAELLEALGQEKDPAKAGAGKTDPEDEKKKSSMFCIYVTDGDKKEVKVKVPKGLVGCIGKFIPKGMSAKIITEDKETDLSEFLKAFDDCGCGCGEILSVDKDGKKVRICCET